MARNSARKGVISVFGSGSVLYESSAYATAQELGRLIAEAGYKTQTGGYGGVMEAAARGAKQAGGDSIGCLLKKWPKGNPFLVESLVFDDIYDRLRFCYYHRWRGWYFSGIHHLPLAFGEKVAGW